MNPDTVKLLGGLVLVFLVGMGFGWVLFRRRQRGYNYRQQRYSEFAAAEVDLGALELT